MVDGWRYYAPVMYNLQTESVADRIAPMAARLHGPGWQISEHRYH